MANMMSKLSDRLSESKSLNVLFCPNKTCIYSVFVMFNENIYKNERSST